jgi:molybdopterin-guanine dinucleotide biosynthesis protein A
VTYGPGRAIRVDGLVLAGGRSLRFGSDKRLALFDGNELVRLAASKLASVCDGIVYVGTGTRRERLPVSGLTVLLVDDPRGRGPLGGIAAALRRSRDGVLVLACDLPLVRASTLERLVRAARRGRRPAALHSGAGWEPLVAWYPRAALHVVESELRSAKPAPYSVLERLGAAALPVMDLGEVINVNTPGDLDDARIARAERIERATRIARAAQIEE